MFTQMFDLACFGVTCSPRDLRFGCSTLAGVDGFFLFFFTQVPPGCGSRVGDF